MMNIAFSSCPNDIFLFRSFLQQDTLYASLHIADISQLNMWALQRKYPLIKISAALFPQVSNHYRLMHTGSILGYGVGPLVLKRKDNPQPIHTIATPGATTTAHTLCRMFYPHARLVTMTYHEVIPAVLRQEVCAGVVIHEERFTYPPQLSIDQNLGELWHSQEHKPLPLGCLVIDQRIPQEEEQTLTIAIQESLRHALHHMEESLALAAQYARNKEFSVIEQFIATYVNDETFSLSTTGLQALQTLWTHADTHA